MFISLVDSGHLQKVGGRNCSGNHLDPNRWFVAAWRHRVMKETSRYGIGPSRTFHPSRGTRTRNEMLYSMHMVGLDLTGSRGVEGVTQGIGCPVCQLK